MDARIDVGDLHSNRSALLEAIHLVASLHIARRNTAASQRLNELEEKVRANMLQLVVLGQFKRGKTTLINALLGAELLPTAIIPLTSIITVLQYGTREKVTVQLLYGRQQEITVRELADYVTEPGNPGNARGVDKVVIEYPSPYLRNGVQIIDTPGVGSVYRHNTDVAYEFVPKADAGIFVVTADPPISQADLEFLVSIKTFQCAAGQA